MNGSITKATALEILSEPLSLLVLLASVVMAVGAPALHYHQFGDPTRMARDAGFSSIFTCGTVIAVFCTIRSFRREIESGTMAMALVHPVSRTSFFISKTLGAFAAYLVYSSIVAMVTLITVKGAEIGGEIAAAAGGIARLWGPSLAIGFSVALLPLMLSAVLNRFFRVRFVLSCFVASFAVAAAGIFYRFDASLFSGYFPAFVALNAPAAVFLSAAAAFSVRFSSNAAAALTMVVFSAAVPFIGNYHLADSLAGGGTVSWGYVLQAVATAVPASGAFIALGAVYAGGKELS